MRKFCSVLHSCVDGTALDADKSRTQWPQTAYHKLLRFTWPQASYSHAGTRRNQNDVEPFSLPPVLNSNATHHTEQNSCKLSESLFCQDTSNGPKTTQIFMLVSPSKIFEGKQVGCHKHGSNARKIKKNEQFTPAKPVDRCHTWPGFVAQKGHSFWMFLGLEDIIGDLK